MALSINIFHDMEEQHVWAYVVTIAITGILLFIMIVSHYGEKEDRMIQELVEAGHDPMELACLYNHDDNIKMACFQLFDNAIEKKEGGEK